jgi:hypothetical protein
MKPCRVIFVLFLLGLSLSCGPSSNVEKEAEEGAAYHMLQADSLESMKQLERAAFEYNLVAKYYPATSHYPLAVRNAALLYSNSANPAVDDSVALRLFETYLTLPISREEKNNTEVYVTMLRRITALQRETSSRIPSSDSLLSIIRRQSGEVAARNKRIQDLEAELTQTKTELQRLRDVDIRINRRKGTR